MSPTTFSSPWTIIRFLMLLWTITSIILTTSYSARLSSNGLIPRMSKPIETMSDLVEANIPCCIRDPYVLGLLNTSSSKETREVANHVVMSKTGRYGECQEIVVLEERTIIPTYPNKTDVEKLMMFNDKFLDTYNAVALAKNSPYKKVFNERLNQLTEHGFIMKWIRDEKSMTLQTDDFRGSYRRVATGIVKLSMAKMQGAFILLIVGYGISVGALICEYFKQRHTIL